MPIDFGSITSVGKGLFNRMKDIFYRIIGRDPESPKQEPVLKEEPMEEVVTQPDINPDIATIKLRIQQAAENRVLLWINYQRKGVTAPVDRNVEPYSYRQRQRNSAYPLFMAYCHKDNRTEAFILERIKAIMVTNIPFTPRWKVEFPSDII